MNYSQLTDSTLQEFHTRAKHCLLIDDYVPVGQDKPFGVRQQADWKQHITAIEDQLTERKIIFTPLDIVSSPSPSPSPSPYPSLKTVEETLYEKIRECLTIDDSVSGRENKPYGVRTHPDWQVQANALENHMDEKGIKYTKIIW